MEMKRWAASLPSAPSSPEPDASACSVPAVDPPEPRGPPQAAAPPPTADGMAADADPPPPLVVPAPADDDGRTAAPFSSLRASDSAMTPHVPRAWVAAGEEAADSVATLSVEEGPELPSVPQALSTPVVAAADGDFSSSFGKMLPRGGVSKGARAESRVGRDVINGLNLLKNA